MVNSEIFREYDIRGIVGRDIDRKVAVLIGRALGTLVFRTNPQAGCLSVGRDVRTSSSELASGIIEGITSTGINVYDIGICPTPLQYFSLFHLAVDGGIMVTGSHNPPEYNGFKLSIKTETIYGKAIQDLKDIILKSEWKTAGKKGNVENYDITETYKNYMMERFSYLGSAGYKRLKAVVDAGNGTAGMVVPEILEDIGCEVVPLYCEPDGTFPNHHPDPTVVENMQDMMAKTKNTGADIGVGYDGDADRIGVVDRDGNIVWGDQLMIVLCRNLLEKKRGIKVIGDVKCSQIMFDDIRKRGGRPIMWKTGHSLIKQKMREEGALIAGEFSGHIFIGDGYFGYDDAIYTTLRIVEIMKNTGKDIKDLLSDVPHICNTPEIRIDCPEGAKNRVVENIVNKFMKYKENGGSQYKIRDLSMVDGIRMVFDKGWGLMRASNTQPAVVMRVEAEDEISLNNYRSFLEKEFKEAMEAQ